jgi:hypothetical protein
MAPSLVLALNTEIMRTMRWLWHFLQVLGESASFIGRTSSKWFPQSLQEYS